MSSRTWRLGSGLAAAALLVTLTACSDAGDLSIVNAGPTEVTVLTGDEKLTVSPDGGVVLLGQGCTSGDVTVQFPSAESVVVSGPVCPDQEIVIGDGTVDLRPATHGI